MKKKVLLIVGAIIIIIIGVIAYFVISDILQEEKLKTELLEISELSNEENLNIDEINKRLDRTVTKGDYAIVETAFKNYLKDNFQNIIEISEILNDEKLVNLLTAENYKEDGKDFVESKNYITTTREKLENCKTEYKQFFTEEKAMSYINDKGLDSYYTDLYKQEYVGDIENTDNDTIVENSINEVIEVLNISEEVLNFLSENKNSWSIEGDNIVFNSESLSNQYEELLNKLS